MTPEVYRLHQKLEETHWWFKARRRILLDILGKLLPPDKKSHVIDVGCATGGNAAAIDERYSCLGVDASALAIEMARARFPSTRFEHADSPVGIGGAACEAMAFLVADVLEHVADDRAILAEWVRAARPGAWFTITVPAEMSLWSTHDVSHGHYRRYDRESLAGLWSDLPVCEKLLSPFNSRLYGVIKQVRRRRQRLAEANGAAAGLADLRQPGKIANKMLEAVFYGESKRLVAALRGEGRGYRRGVSLIAVLRKH